MTGKLEEGQAQAGKGALPAMEPPSASSLVSQPLGKKTGGSIPSQDGGPHQRQAPPLAAPKTDGSLNHSGKEPQAAIIL